MHHCQEHSQETLQVVVVVNTLLAERLQGKSCTLKQKEIIERRQAQYGSQKCNYTSLDVMERLFVQAGRKVSYDKPGYSESYDAYFEFRMP
ncbi:MAG: hypothetical protein H6765_08165 [Candidatus Peribacteria bacterium]|nr:MAG: hypothetical protein H6765_08165 [Candidatus Peribacteria bacterium]